MFARGLVHCGRGDSYLVLVEIAWACPGLLGQNQVTVPGEALWFEGEADGDVGPAGREARTTSGSGMLRATD
jgi:hypothetical protein